MESNNPFDLLKEEMENDDNSYCLCTYVSRKNNLRPPSLYFKYFITFNEELCQNEDDEVLLAIAEQTSKFKLFLDSNQLLSLIPIFQFLLCVEETVVREQTVENMREYTACFNDEQTQSSIMTLINNIANQEYFTGKVSACYIIRMIYAKAGKHKETLKNMYFKFCDDETPLIKRTAAKEFGLLCQVMDKETVFSDMINYYKKFICDSDNIKVIALDSLIQLVKLFQNTDQQRLNVQTIIQAGDDKSWRVRHELAKIFPNLIEGFGTQINELIPTYGNLIKDSEMEVRHAALEGLTQVLKHINAEKITISIIPNIIALQNESSYPVKICIGEGLGVIAKIVGYTTFNSKLGFIIEQLIRDDHAEVRLGIARSLYDIFVTSEGQLLTSTNNLIAILLKDLKSWRLRETMFEVIAKLGAHFGPEVFKSHFDSLFFLYLTDLVANVREAAIHHLEIICAKFGEKWILATLIPKLQTHLNQPKLAYLHRMSAINSLAVCAKYLNPNQINEFILPHILKCLKDKVANVRYSCIRLIDEVIKNLDSNSKDKVKSAVKDLTSDEDNDVKFFAHRFLGLI